MGEASAPTVTVVFNDDAAWMRWNNNPSGNIVSVKPGKTQVKNIEMSHPTLDWL